MQLTKLFKGLLSVSIAAAVCGANAQTATSSNPYTEGTDAAKIQNQPTNKAKRKAGDVQKPTGEAAQAQVSGPSGTVTRDIGSATGSSGAAGATGSSAGASASPAATGATASPAAGTHGSHASGATTPVTGTSSDVGGSAGTSSGAVTTGTSATTGATATGTTTTPPAQP